MQCKRALEPKRLRVYQINLLLLGCCGIPYVAVAQQKGSQGLPVERVVESVLRAERVGHLGSFHSGDTAKIFGASETLEFLKMN